MFIKFNVKFNALLKKSTNIISFKAQLILDSYIYVEIKSNPVFTKNVSTNSILKLPATPIQ